MLGEVFSNVITNLTFGPIAGDHRTRRFNADDGQQERKRSHRRRIKVKWIVCRLALILALLISACGVSPDDPTTPGSTPPTGGPGSVPADASPVFVDSTDILLLESFPVQVMLEVVGSVPTPCHGAVWDVEDDGSTIDVTLGSVADPGTQCAQVLSPIDLSIPLGSFESGGRTVTLNGEPIGDFEI